MPLIIAALWAALVPVLRTWLPSLVGRVLLAFGIGLFTHSVAMPALLAMVQGYVNAIPQFAREMFGAVGLDVGVTMILSAYAARAASKVVLSKLPS